MPLTLEEMARKGVEKLTGKLEDMKKDYEAAVSKAISNYEALPFGPRTKAKYRNAMQSYAVEDYKAKMTPDIVEKWKKNWVAGVSK